MKVRITRDHVHFLVGEIVEVKPAPKWCWSHLQGGYHAVTESGYELVVLPEDCEIVQRDFQDANKQIEKCLEIINDGIVTSKEEIDVGIYMLEQVLEFCHDNAIIDDYDSENLRQTLNFLQGVEV